MFAPTRAFAAAAAVVLGLGLGVVDPGPALAATGCASGVPGDVNGDGYAETAVSSREPQAVHVFYGSRSGLQVNAKGSALDDQVFTQDTRGIPGAPGRDEAFGQSTTFGDFDGDGCADLAIGAPRDYSASGTVTILYGTPRGLTTSRVLQLVGVDSLPGDWYVGQFGYRLDHGDVTNDGVDDLLVSVPNAIDNGSDVGNSTLVVYTGGAGGLSKAADRRIPLTGDGDLGGDFEAGIDDFAVGDFDGNGSNELAVVSGGIKELTFSTDRLVAYRQALADTGDELVAGDVDGDGRDDLAFETYPEEETVAVALAFGSANGLSGSGRRSWSDAALGLGGNYGALELAMGRLDRDAYADLVVTGEHTKVGSAAGAGALTVLFGGTGGPTLDHVVHLSEATAGVPGTAEKADGFGASVSVGQVQGGGQASLVVGAPNESSTKTSAGRFYFFPRSTSGPAARGSRALSLDTAGVKGRSARESFFGLNVGGPGSWSVSDD